LKAVFFRRGTSFSSAADRSGQFALIPIGCNWAEHRYP
jgi:hypothetical protein